MARAVLNAALALCILCTVQAAFRTRRAGGLIDGWVGRPIYKFIDWVIDGRMDWSTDCLTAWVSERPRERASAREWVSECVSAWVSEGGREGGRKGGRDVAEGGREVVCECLIGVWLSVWLIDIPAGDCSSSPCQYAGTCTEDVGAGTYSCECPFGYQGENCELGEYRMALFCESCTDSRDGGHGSENIEKKKVEVGTWLILKLQLNEIDCCIPRLKEAEFRISKLLMLNRQPGVKSQFQESTIDQFERNCTYSQFTVILW